jgi:arginine deiminase
MRARHEGDPCHKVFVATPHVPSILECNQDPARYLYQESVDPTLLLEQHAALVTTLRNEGICVADVAPPSPPSCQLGNLVFTRDPILCTRKGIVLGRFRESVRQAETTLWEGVLAEHGLPYLGRVLGTESFVEGGDFLPAGDVAFLGTGNRTNEAGAHELMSRDWLGCPRVAVVKHPADGNMHAIHLDCYLGIVDDSLAVVWDHAAEHVLVDEYERDAYDGSYAPRTLDMPLGEYLERSGWRILCVPTASQRNYGCNLLSLGRDHKVLVQDPFVAAGLREVGYCPIELEFGELHKMYGGIRCATQVLRASNPKFDAMV